MMLAQTVSIKPKTELSPDYPRTWGEYYAENKQVVDPLIALYGDRGFRDIFRCLRDRRDEWERIRNDLAPQFAKPVRWSSFAR